MCSCKTRRWWQRPTRDERSQLPQITLANFVYKAPILHTSKHAAMTPGSWQRHTASLRMKIEGCPSLGSGFSKKQDTQARRTTMQMLNVLVAGKLAVLNCSNSSGVSLSFGRPYGFS